MDNEINIANKIKETYECDIIFNDVEPYTLYRTSHIGNILELSNIRCQTSTFNNTEKVNIKVCTSGGKQLCSYLTYKGLLKLLYKSRKPSYVDFCKLIGIDIYNYMILTIENETLEKIQKVFNGEEMIMQHKILNYRVDLYFPKYKIIIECDETHHHSRNNIIQDINRENNIKEILCDCKFIRYDPYDKDFCIFNVINQIYKTINNIHL
jgi:very-short-patch-repair endonuclease